MFIRRSWKLLSTCQSSVEFDANELRERIDRPVLEALIKDRFTSRDGFISSYSRSITEWETSTSNWTEFDVIEFQTYLEHFLISSYGEKELVFLEEKLFGRVRERVNELEFVSYPSELDALNQYIIQYECEELQTFEEYKAQMKGKLGEERLEEIRAEQKRRIDANINEYISEFEDNQ